MTDEIPDNDVRTAFDDLRSARREIEDPGSDRMKWVPLGVLAFLVGLVAISVVLTNQGGPEQVVTDTATDSDEVVADSLTGTTWRLLEGAPIINGWPITLTFEAGTFGGTAACNGYGGAYAVSGSTIVLTDLGQNAMGCEDRVQKSEEVFMAELSMVDSFRFEEDRLILRGAEHDLVFVPDAALDIEALIGVTWILDSYSDGDELTAAGGTGGYLLINGDGTLEGGTGCRSLSGTWIESGAEILFPNFGAEGECSEELSRQDNQVVTVLGDGFRAEVDGPELFLTSSGNERLAYHQAADGEVPGEPAAADEVGFPFDESLTWSVILVEADDVLNVRSGPGVDNEIIGELEPYETGITIGTEVVDVGGALWRQIHTPSIPGGWVNEQYVTAQPVGGFDESRMLGLADAFLIEVPGSRPESRPYPISVLFSPTGIWIGGIGVYADFPFPARRVPAEDLADLDGWATPVDFTPREMSELGQDCPECVVSPLDFIRLPETGREWELVVDEDLLHEDAPAGPAFRNGLVADLANMHHVTIDVPASGPGDLDWQRIHLFFDWRTGEPLLHAIYTWGWTP